MSERRDRPDEDALYAVAESRAGYFTARDAQRAGYSRSLLAHHAGSGKFERVARGVYRLVRFPETPGADVLVAWLRAGEGSAVSHDSALAMYGLSDALPTAVHVTVPRTASRRRSGIRLHTSALDEADVTEFEGLRVTTIERTLADVARSGLASELVLQAIAEAVQRGLTTPERLMDFVERRGGRARRLVAEALGEGGP